MSWKVTQGSICLKNTIVRKHLLNVSILGIDPWTHVLLSPPNFFSWLTMKTEADVLCSSNAEAISVYSRCALIRSQLRDCVMGHSDYSYSLWFLSKQSKSLKSYLGEERDAKFGLVAFFIGQWKSWRCLEQSLCSWISRRWPWKLFWVPYLLSRALVLPDLILLWDTTPALLREMPPSLSPFVRAWGRACPGLVKLTSVHLGIFSF